MGGEGSERAKLSNLLCRQVQIIQNEEKGLACNGVQSTAERCKTDERQGKRKKRSSTSLTVGADVKLVKTAENLQGKSVEADSEDVQQKGPSKKKKKRRDISSVDEECDGELRTPSLVIVNSTGLSFDLVGFYGSLGQIVAL